jgi:hypothetical protein
MENKKCSKRLEVNFFIIFIVFLFCLTFTNGRVSAELSKSHPRLMNQEWIDKFIKWSDESWEPYLRFRNFANKSFGGAYDTGILFSKALMWKMGKGEIYLTDALAYFDTLVNKVGTSTSNIGTRAQFIAMTYDLLYDKLSDSSRRNAVDKFIEWQDIIKKQGAVSTGYPLWNYSVSLWAPTMVAAAAGAGDSSNTTNDLESEYSFWKNNYFLPGLSFLNELLKGEMTEGTYYGTIIDTREFLKAAEAVFMAEGENVYSNNEWFGKRLVWEWQSFISRPKFIDPIGGDYGNYYHSWGHSERVRATLPAVSRLNTLLLMSRLPSHEYRGQITYSLYKNSDTDLNKMAYDTTYYAAIYAFIYSEKDALSDAVAPSLQLWTTNLNTTYGPGKVFIRSGYSPDDIYITFKAGDMYYRGHENLEEGSFQIFAKGEDIAIHSGSYAGSGDMIQTYEYWSRTVSTNSLIIYDPSEKFWFIGRSVDNDGGQRTYTDSPQMYKSIEDWKELSNFSSGGTNPHGANHHGKVLKADNKYNDFSYVFSDITLAYNSDDYIEGATIGNKAKVSKVTRELALLNNKYVVIFDKLQKKSPTDFTANHAEGEPYPYQDKWLLHSQENFNVNGSETFPSDGEQLYKNSNGSFSTTVNSASLYGQVVYPNSNFQIRRFNGSKRYWNYQRNVPMENNQGNWYDIEWGKDRIEIEPTDTSLDHYYLVVLYPEYTSGPKLPETVAVAVTSGQMKGTHIKDSSANVIALFGDSMSDTNVLNFAYQLTTNSNNNKHYIFDLKPSTQYSVKIDGNKIDDIISSENGVILLTDSLTGSHVYSFSSSATEEPDTSGGTTTETPSDTPPTTTPVDTVPPGTVEGFSFDE